MDDDVSSRYRKNPGQAPIPSETYKKGALYKQKHFLFTYQKQVQDAKPTRAKTRTRFQIHAITAFAVIA